MRKFIVKYGFGQYWYKYPWQGEKRQFNNVHRGSFWYGNGFLLILIIGLIYRLVAGEFGNILYLSIPWFLFVLYFGFPVAGIGYFQKFPVQWNELDDEQKWYYGNGVNSGDLRKKIYLTPEQQEEYVEIKARMQIKYKLE